MLHPFRHQWNAMGSLCELHLFAPDLDLASHTAGLVMTEVQRIERRYSRYRSDSLLSDINRIAQAGGSISVDEETAGILNYAHACWLKSDGLFDITSGLLRHAWDFRNRRIPYQSELDALLPRIGWEKACWNPPTLHFPVRGMEFDLGGIGKEYAADRAAEICRQNGIRHGLVDLSGDLYALGPLPDGQPWNVGIRNPQNPEQPLFNYPLFKGGLTTSGDYARYIDLNGRRYSHLLNPRTGWPVEGLASVTAIAPQCLVAGSVSTIAMLKGPEGIPWLQTLGIDAFWVETNGRTGGLFPRSNLARSA